SARLFHHSCLDRLSGRFPILDLLTFRYCDLAYRHSSRVSIRAKGFSSAHPARQDLPLEPFLACFLQRAVIQKGLWNHQRSNSADKLSGNFKVRGQKTSSAVRLRRTTWSGVVLGHLQKRR